jgi:thioredoxin reductase
MSITEGQDLTTYDVVVVGGGAAGLSGALTLGRARRSVLVVDAGEPRNSPAPGVHGFLTRDGTNPAVLLEAGREEVQRYGVELLDGRVASAERVEDGFVVTLDDGNSVGARRLLVATGLADELPEVPGVRQRWGRDVLHCPYCHGWEVRDQPIGVLASGPRAAHQALLFRQWSADVALFLHTAPLPTDEEAEKLAACGIAVVEGEVASLEIVEDRLAGVRMGGGEVVARRAVAVMPRFVARTEMLAGLGLETTVHPLGVGEHVEADAAGLTAAPGVWVAGNVADLMAHVVSAAEAGVRAGAAINADLVAEDNDHAVTAYRARREARVADGC